MSKIKSSFIKLFISICILPLLWQPAFAETKTKPTKTDSDSEEKIVFIDEFDPPGDDKPKDTGAGGSRDGLGCNPNEQPIRALMPPGNFGLTTKAQPTIYLYLPQTTAKQVVIAIQNENRTVYKRAFLPIEINNNIASFFLSKNIINLEAGKNYQWKISVICDEYLKPGDPTFSGWLQRVEPTTIDKQLNNKNSNEQIQYFAEHGYWYDLLDVISLHNNWQQVLN